ncbi:MAG: PqqD family protein [Methylotenera sp.]|nr:PqqD family protein [Methylotenera sp.]
MAVKDKDKAKALHRLSALHFYEGEFVLNTMSGLFYRLTPAASYLLRSLDAGVEIEQLAALIQTRYGVDQKTAVRDVELLLNQLAEVGLLDQSQE